MYYHIDQPNYLNRLFLLNVIIKRVVKHSIKLINIIYCLHVVTLLNLPVYTAVVFNY